MNRPPELKSPTLDEIVKIYDASQTLVDMLDVHQWGKRLTDRDAKFISNFRSQVTRLGNMLFWAHHAREGAPATLATRKVIETMNAYLLDEDNHPGAKDEWYDTRRGVAALFLKEFALHLGYQGIEINDTTNLLEAKDGTETK